MASVRGAGFSSGVFEDHNFEQLRRNLDRAAELGVDFVELRIAGLNSVGGDSNSNEGGQ